MGIINLKYITEAQLIGTIVKKKYLINRQLYLSEKLLCGAQDGRETGSGSQPDADPVPIQGEPDPPTLSQRDTVADVWATLMWSPHVSGPSPADLSQRRLIPKGQPTLVLLPL